DDEVANTTYVQEMGTDAPLALFTAPRTDLSIMRLKHYTGTSAKHFQNFIIFTNYQFYIDEFVRICKDIMTETNDPDLKAERCEYASFVEPGNTITLNKRMPHLPDRDERAPQISRMPQMPAFPLPRGDGNGITMVN